jgi:predicted RNA binding protein with dsRBD fold (UPF0201 family)
LLTVEAPVRPSEDEQKVRRAILNLFPDVELRRMDGALAGEGRSLNKFGELLRRFRIRDAARGQLLHGRRGDNCTVFRLSKQAAYVERVNFSPSESPLGDITVRIEDEQLDGLIDRLAPDTRPPHLRVADIEGKGGPGPAGRMPRRHIREKLELKDIGGEDILDEDG